MRNSQAVDVFSCLVMLASAGMFASLIWDGNPSPHPGIHRAIGRTLGLQAKERLTPGGRITILLRDTSSFRQPGADLLLEGLRRELQSGVKCTVIVHPIEVDPARAEEISSEDFVELIRKAAPGDVIVSAMGPPQLNEEQRLRLGTIKPRIIAFCPRYHAEDPGIRQPIEQGILDVALVSRLIPDSARRVDPNLLPQLYEVVSRQ
ncbi:MAG: hypothetical protein EXS36_10630 [Pedosphaera sp.]|nr:hypothetical protein [Pedosphaera sp.]